MAAELSTPSAADLATARQPTPSKASKDKHVPTARPERPDEEQYKAELVKAEKELKAAEDRMARPLFPLRHLQPLAYHMQPWSFGEKEQD